MGTPVIYDQFKVKQHDGNAIDMDTDTIKVMIVTNSYTPNQATHATKSDITNEVTGTNYSAGGTAISGVTLTLSSHIVTFAHNNITWTQSSGAGFSTGRTFIWYKDTGVAGTSRLICYQQEASDFGNVAGDLILSLSVSGAIQIS